MDNISHGQIRCLAICVQHTVIIIINKYSKKKYCKCGKEITLEWDDECDCGCCGDHEHDCDCDDCDCDDDEE